MMATSTASVTLTSKIMDALDGYRQAAGLRLNIYPGRPTTLNPPNAFIDARHDEITSTGDSAFNAMDHRATIEVVVVHGLFDTAEAILQRDAWVDGFNTYLRDEARQVGLAGGNSVLERWTVDDTPDYTPNWTATAVAYYATVYRLEVSLSD